MPKQRYKVALELFFDIDEITEATVYERAEHFSNRDQILAEPATWEHMERQKRLHDLLLSNDSICNRYVQKRLGEMLADSGREIFADLQILEEDEDILAPVIQQLSPDDSSVFLGAIESNLFYENSEEFSSVFSLSLAKSTITKIN